MINIFVLLLVLEYNDIDKDWAYRNKPFKTNIKNQFTNYLNKSGAKPLVKFYYTRKTNLYIIRTIYNGANETDFIQINISAIF